MMLKSLIAKIKEATLSVVPVSVFVLVLYFTPLLSLTNKELGVFIFSAIFLVIGMALFSLGADISMGPMGEQIGSSLMKSQKYKKVLLIAFLMGFLITIAEPDLTVLANQVSEVINNYVLIITVGIGVGVFLAIAMAKIIHKRDLVTRIIFFYFLMFSFICLLLASGNNKLVALALDSGGVTTGPITVPFIMALGLGAAQTIGGREVKENSFGLIALCSIGPIIVLALLGVFMDNDISYEVSNFMIPENLLSYIANVCLHSFKDVIIALVVIAIFFLIINRFFIHLPLRGLVRLGFGLLYTLLGLVIFLSAATVGFMPIGYNIGYMIAEASPYWLCLVGFIIGLLVVLAEPAVHVLTKNVEAITMGSISKREMLIALSMGVGLSILLSMIRIVFHFSILYYIVPGYIISLGLSFFVPKMYTAIAFDSGGVASGPLTSSFILPLSVGACMMLHGSDMILENAFGVVSMVAMTPLITIQMLGFKSRIKEMLLKKKRTKLMIDADDDQIIYFG